MEQKHLIIVDEQSQSATLDAIKNTLKNEGIDLVYKEINPANFQKRVGYNTSFDKISFIEELQNTPFLKKLDAFASDYNLIENELNGLDVVKIFAKNVPSYHKKILLYSAKIENVISDILLKNKDFEEQKKTLKFLSETPIEYAKNDEKLQQNLISHIKKEKDFDFERELCDWLMSNELIYKFPPYEGIPCCKIGDILLSKNTSDSIKLKRDLLEQFIAYLSTFNEIPHYV